MIDHGPHVAGYEALLDLRSKDIDDGSMNYSLFLAVATQIVSRVRFLRKEGLLIRKDRQAYEVPHRTFSSDCRDLSKS